MNGRVRKIRLILLTVLIVASLSVMAMIALMGGGNELERGDAFAAGSFEPFHKTYVLKDGDGKTKVDIWSTEILSSDNQGKNIYVKLGEDWCLDGTGQPNTQLTIPLNYNITFDLNGYTLSRNLSAVATDGRCIDISASSTFTLTDTTGGGKITGGKVRIGGGIYVNGTFIMNGGEISGNTSAQNGGGVTVSATGQMTMNGGKISGNTTGNDFNINGQSGGGICVNGIFTMNGGEISNNTGGSGGGLSVSRWKNLTDPESKRPPGKAVINGGIITKNTSNDVSSLSSGGSVGGGVCLSHGATLEMNGGEIYDNTDPSGTMVAV